MQIPVLLDRHNTVCHRDFSLLLSSGSGTLGYFPFVGDIEDDPSNRHRVQMSNLNLEPETHISWCIWLVWVFAASRYIAWADRALGIANRSWALALEDPQDLRRPFVLDCYLSGFLIGGRFDLRVMNPGLEAVHLDCSWGSQDHNMRTFPARTQSFFFMMFHPD